VRAAVGETQHVVLQLIHLVLEGSGQRGPGVVADDPVGRVHAVLISLCWAVV
jgi:hypothetical protein